MDPAQETQHSPKHSNLAVVAAFFILLAIPITVVAVTGYRTLNSEASVAVPTNLRPSGTAETTNPSFSWACCNPGKFTVYLRERDANFFGGGSWSTNVFQSSSGTTRQYVGWNHGSGWTATNYQSPPAELKPSTLYAWVVAACDATLFGADCRQSNVFYFFTPADTSPPSTPTNLRAAVVLSDQVALAWNASSDNVGVAQYLVNRVSSEGSVLTIPSSVNNFIDKQNITPGATYKYSVKAYDAANNSSGSSNEITVKVPGGGDFDGDGFPDILETYIGTNPNAKCGLNAWPIDINNDKRISVIDEQLLSQHIGGSERRYDLNADGKIDNNDLNIIAVNFGKTCT